MSKRIRITAIYRQEPEIRLFVLALIELARQLNEAEQAARPPRAEGQQVGDSSQ